MEKKKDFHRRCYFFRPEIVCKHFSLRRMLVGISSVYSELVENKEKRDRSSGRRGFLSRERFPFRPSPFSRTRDQKIPDPQLRQSNLTLLIMLFERLP